MREKIVMIIRIVLWSAILIAGIFIVCGCQADLEDVYNEVSPSVVWIGAEYSDDNSYYYDYHDDYYDETQKRGSIKWQGTGFIINSDGLIATAGHVVENTETFQLVFSDGRKGRAEFAYKESSGTADVGFIQITSIDCDDFHILEWLNPVNFVNWIVDNELPPEEIKGLPYVNLTNKIRITERLIIVGYPWGLAIGETVTQGIVSALDRDIPFFGEKFMIHTDTASWPGNSGSAVFNMDGNVVGILVGGMRGCDNFSLCTPSKIVMLALDKYEAEKAMKEAK